MAGLLLPLTDTAIAACRDHLQAFPEADPVIAAYLTRYVSLLLCGEIETSVTQAITERVRGGGCDQETTSLILTMRGNLVRNAKISEIGNRLAAFSTDCKTRYQETVQADPGEAGISRLGTLVGYRDRNAHGDPQDVTFAELEAAYDAAKAVVRAARLAMGLPGDPP